MGNHCISKQQQVPRAPELQPRTASVPHKPAAPPSPSTSPTTSTSAQWTRITESQLEKIENPYKPRHDNQLALRQQILAYPKQQEIISRKENQSLQSGSPVKVAVKRGGGNGNQGNNGVVGDDRDYRGGYGDLSQFNNVSVGRIRKVSM